MALLSVSEVGKIYTTRLGGNKVEALKSVTFDVEKGEYVAIMGESGSGKTTLLNILASLDKATSGEVTLDGKKLSEINEKQISAFRRDNLGFVFQNFELLSRQTALANVELPLVYAGVRKRERIQRAKQALTRVGLADRMNFTPAQLSGGQKQRVAIARAMVNHPRLLLADEPTGALDSRSSTALMELFEELNNEGVTILMITHSPEIASYAKRVCNIFDGILTERTDSDRTRIEAAGGGR